MLDEAQVLATAAHVCLYKMHVTSQQWVRETIIGGSASILMSSFAVNLMPCHAGEEERGGLAVPAQEAQGASLPDDGPQQTLDRCREASGRGTRECSITQHSVSFSQWPHAHGLPCNQPAVLMSHACLPPHSCPCAAQITTWRQFMRALTLRSMRPISCTRMATRR